MKRKRLKGIFEGFLKGSREITSSKPTNLHEVIYMARELVEQAVQGKAAKVSESNKMKWEDQQGNNHHQQQNQRQKTAKAYVAAPAEGRGYAGNLSWCNRCKAHHQPECDMLWLWGEWTLQGQVSKRKKPVE
uniref:Reverse transcriptase domain-containing protein n=1 Tax=Tanacetum cinerariifolium TaxID=118510 RepID=A0A6L2PBU2_TANCI|nr:reverse transcriptase domain-containing protein [Tanacetum cinerariifolium]